MDALERRGSVGSLEKGGHGYIGSFGVCMAAVTTLRKLHVTTFRSDWLPRMVHSRCRIPSAGPGSGGSVGFRRVREVAINGIFCIQDISKNCGRRRS